MDSIIYVASRTFASSYTGVYMNIDVETIISINLQCNINIIT